MQGQGNEVRRSRLWWLPLLLLALAAVSWLVGWQLREDAPQMQVGVYMEPGASEDDRSAVQAALRGITQVTDVVYVSQEEAFAEFRHMFANNPNLTATIDPEILPTSYRATVSEPLSDNMTTRLHAMPGVSKVAYLKGFPDWSQIVESLHGFGIDLRVGQRGDGWRFVGHLLAAAGIGSAASALFASRRPDRVGEEES